jgi:SAM-dependent methyltransferase
MISGSMKQMDACVVCHGELTLFGPHSNYTYCRCPDCGTIQLSPMPDKEEMARAYETEYAEQKLDPEVWRRASRPYYDSIIRVLSDYRVKGLVVDYGAAKGHLVERMIQSGFNARGVELSKDEAAYAQQHGLPVQQGDLNSLSEVEGQVAALTMSAVFEHLLDHAAVLSAVHSLLTDDGLFITMHPTAGSANLFGNLLRFGDKHKPLPGLAGVIDAPWHTVLFSIDGTEQLLSQQGFRVLEIRPAPQGRLGGIRGLVQILLEQVNKLGWGVMRTRWPLVTTHIFVCQKVAQATMDQPSMQDVALSSRNMSRR